MDDFIMRASRTTAGSIGVLAGIGGLTHGIGEVRQGNVPTGGLFFESWTTGPIASHLGGEPGLSVIPNVLLSGILTLAIATAVIVWSAFYVHRKRGGLVLILLSIGMLLTGGGVGPPVMGILAGWAGTRVVPIRENDSTVVGKRRGLGRLWPVLFGISLVAALLLVIGSLVSVYFFDLHNPDFFTGLFGLVVVLMLITVPAAFAYDRVGISGSHE